MTKELTLSESGGGKSGRGTQQEVRNGVHQEGVESNRKKVLECETGLCHLVVRGHSKGEKNQGDAGILSTGELGGERLEKKWGREGRKKDVAVQVNHQLGITRQASML